MIQESRAQSGFPPLTGEELAGFYQDMEYMRDFRVDVDLWIDRDDYLIRQYKTHQHLPDYIGTVHTTSITMRYVSFNEPVVIESPLDAHGSLLSGWSLAGSIKPQPPYEVFTSYVVMTIGAEPGYNDPAHQQMNFRISLTNQSAEKVNDVRVLAATLVAGEAQKPQVVQAEPETPGIRDFEPDQTGTYKISLSFDGSSLSKHEISRLAEETIIAVHFTTRDGRELTQQIYPYPHPPSDTRPSRAPQE